MVLDRVKNTERQEGVEEILLPGERGSRMAAQRLASGLLPLEANLFNGLKAMADKYDSGADQVSGGACKKDRPVRSITWRSMLRCKR